MRIGIKQPKSLSSFKKEKEKTKEKIDAIIVNEIVLIWEVEKNIQQQ